MTGCSRDSTRLERIVDEYWEDRLVRSPTFATGIGDHRYDDRLEDVSEEAVLDCRDAQRGYLARLEEVDWDDLSADERLSADILERQLRDSLVEISCMQHLTPLSHQNGPQVRFPLLLVNHPFETAVDYCNYIARLKAFPLQVEQTIDNCRRGMACGYVAPRVIVEKIVPQLRAHITVVDQSDFFSPANQIPESISAEEADELRFGIAEAIETSVVPAYRELLAFVERDYLPACRESIGISEVPNGVEIYDKLARVHTTTDMTIDEIHQTGLEEIARIRGEMLKVAAEMGFSGTVEEFITHMRTDPRYKAESGDALLAGFRRILERTTAQMPKLFGRLPRAKCEVKEIEAFRAPTAAAAYAWPPPPDGSRPGYFYVNTYRATERPTYTMEALTYHESYPGHHLQLALDAENEALPAFRRYGDFTAYIEGWGLYSESLGFEIGGYQDPASRFGRLTYDAWRAARLVVDTGIHRYGWSRQQAIDYMKKNTGLSEVNIESEVDRYIAWPGQALAYKIGELTIQRLRREAEERLGSRFDLRAFHDELLSQGAQPLSVLEQRMQGWIESQTE